MSRGDCLCLREGVDWRELGKDDENVGVDARARALAAATSAVSDDGAEEFSVAAAAAAAVALGLEALSPEATAENNCQ